MVLERTLTDLLEELSAEGHEPMARFVSALGRQPWAHQLRFDLSMLRLWLAAPNVSSVQVMVTYGDGRGGGRPLNKGLDNYELTIFRGDHVALTASQTLSETVDCIGDWVANGFKQS